MNAHKHYVMTHNCLSFMLLLHHLTTMCHSFAILTTNNMNMTNLSTKNKGIVCQVNERNAQPVDKFCTGVEHCIMIFTANLNYSDILVTQTQCFSDHWPSSETDRWCPQEEGICLIDLHTSATEHVCCCKGSNCNKNTSLLIIKEVSPIPIGNATQTTTVISPTTPYSSSLEAVAFYILLCVIMLISFGLVFYWLLRPHPPSAPFCCPKPINNTNTNNREAQASVPSLPSHSSVWRPLQCNREIINEIEIQQDWGRSPPSLRSQNRLTERWTFRFSSWLRRHHLTCLLAPCRLCCPHVISSRSHSSPTNLPSISHNDYLLSQSPHSPLLSSDTMANGGALASHLLYPPGGGGSGPVCTSSSTACAIPPNNNDNDFPGAVVSVIVGGGGGGNGGVSLANVCDKISIKARGRFGAVWRAVYRPKKQEVALKIFSAVNEKSWKTETNIYELLTKVNCACKEVNSPTVNVSDVNILQFFGAEKISENEYWLLTEYHSLGSVHDYLKAGHWLTERELLRIVYGMASGLAYLHEELWIRHAANVTADAVNNTKLTYKTTNYPIHKPSIAHRDLKSKNILLRQDLQPCIGDMELALQFNSSSSFLPEAHIQVMVGTQRYMAPEVLDGAIQFTRQAFLHIDMYALALILWECMICCQCCDASQTLCRTSTEQMEEEKEKEKTLIKKSLIEDETGRPHLMPPPLVVLTKSLAPPTSTLSQSQSPMTINVAQLQNLKRIDPASMNEWSSSSGLISPLPLPHSIPSPLPPPFHNIPQSPPSSSSLLLLSPSHIQTTEFIPQTNSITATNIIVDNQNQKNFYTLPFHRELHGQNPTMELMRDCVVDRRCRPQPFQHWMNHSSLTTLWKTVCECWDPDAEARLSAGCVAQRISYLIQQLSDATTTDSSSSNTTTTTDNPPSHSPPPPPPFPPPSPTPPANTF